MNRPVAVSFLRPAFIALLMLGTLLAADLGTPLAQALPQQSDDQWEVWNQIQPQATSCTTLGHQTNNFASLTAGLTYYFFFNVGPLAQGGTSRMQLTNGTKFINATASAFVTFNPSYVTNGQLLSSTNVTSSCSSGTLTYLIVKATMVIDAPNINQADDYTGSTQVSNGGWSVPSGVTGAIGSRAGIVGYVGSGCSSGTCPTGFEESFVLKADLPRMGEVAALSNQVQLASGSNLGTMTRLNPDGDLYPAATCTTAAQMGSQYGYSQSLTGGAAFGKYLHYVAVRLVSANAGPGTSEKLAFRVTDQRSVSASIDPTHDYAWGNVTLSSIPLTTGAVSLTFDMLLQTVNKTDQLGSWSLTTNDFVSGNFGLNLTSTGAPVYFQLIMQSGETERLGFQYTTTCGTYGGNLTFNGSTSSTNSLFKGSVLTGSYATSYGRDYYPFQLNATPANVAGALYTFVGESCMFASTCSQQPTFIGPSDGVGLFTNFLSNTGGRFNDNVATTKVLGYRLMFPQSPTSAVLQPWNTTQTWIENLTFPTESRELWYTTTLISQPSNTSNVALLAIPSTNNAAVTPALTTYDLFTTNDYSTTITLTTRDCTDGTCSAFNSSYLPASVTATVTIPGTIISNTRTVIATVGDISGGLGITGVVLTGADLGGKTLSVVLSGNTIATQSWSFTVSGSGNWAVDIGAFVSGGVSGTIGATPSGITLTWSGNNTRIVPDSFSLNVTRSAHLAVYLDAIYIQNGVFRAAIQTPYVWDTVQADTITFTFPTLGRVPASFDVGTYLFYGTNVTGTMLSAQENACMYASSASWSASCSTGFSSSDLGVIANGTVARIGLLSQANQAKSVEQQKVTAEQAVLPFLLGFLTPLDSSSASAGTWWMTPLTIILLVSWVLLAVAVIVGRIKGGD